MTRAALLPLLALLAGCSRAAVPVSAPPPAPEPSPRGLGSGVAYLLKHQSDDGAWRSDVYATFKDGTALTGLVLRALQDAADAGDPTDTAARDKASAWLARFAQRDDIIAGPKDGVPYPVYTAALGVVTLSHPENKKGHAAARDAWLDDLLARQLTERNGWTPDDKQYGGWGYYPRAPKKPAPREAVPAQHLLESNLSATVFALDALRAAGHADPETYRQALAFVRSCQNADGGFHFIYDDPVRNKAGLADPGPDGRPRYRSYGSATADGLRALLHCGLKLDAPEVVAARDWLVSHFLADTHPGDYHPAFEPTRNAVYFYYAASVARTFRMLGVKEVRGRHWTDSLSEALLARQKPDGSWANDRDQQRENDPLLATAYAVSALAECRRAAR